MVPAHLSFIPATGTRTHRGKQAILLWIMGPRTWPVAGSRSPMTICKARELTHVFLIPGSYISFSPIYIIYSQSKSALIL